MLQIKDFRETKVYQEIREEGLEQGREEGRRQGREQGREQGRMETQEEIAQRLLKRKVGVKEIVTLTGLSAKKVERLRKQISKREA